MIKVRSAEGIVDFPTATKWDINDGYLIVGVHSTKAGVTWAKRLGAYPPGQWFEVRWVESESS